jgi:hypothetical protein
MVNGDVGRRRWLLTWRHQLLRWTHGWCSRMDQGEGVFTRAPSCARSLGERQCQTIALDVFKACTEECLSWAWRARQEASWKKWLARATPCPIWSRWAVAVRQALSVLLPGLARVVAPGHDVPFSLPQSVTLVFGTILHADVLQLLPVSGVVVIHGCNGMGGTFCPGLKFPLSSLRWHRAMSVQFRPWPHSSPTTCLAPY